MNRGTRCQLRSPRAQRGVVLFVALIAMVVLSLAGVALVRSIEVSTGVAGNIAFRQASIAAVNEAIEQSIAVVFKIKPAMPLNVDLGSARYYASIQGSEKKNGVPDVLSGTYSDMVLKQTAAGLAAPYTDAISGVEVRWVIERVCNKAVMDAGGAVTSSGCDTLPPKVAPAGSIKPKPIKLPPIPSYRVTVRVDIPTVNTATYAQAFMQ